MMPFKLVLLWSDVLFLGLVAACTAGAVWVRRSERLRETWARVGRNRAGMGAAVVLAAFVAVGVLDSLHYRVQLPAQCQTIAFTTTRFFPDFLARYAP